MFDHLTVRWIKLRIAFYAHVLRRLRRSDVAWQSLDRAGIIGHGLDLLRFDFAPDLARPPSWGHGRPAHPGLLAWLTPHAQSCEDHARRALTYLPELASLPGQASPAAPLAWQNLFQTPLDLAWSYGLLRDRPPRKYVEIGSGVSTHLAHLARSQGTPFEIVSIDPQPRADIAGIADRILRARLEDSLDVILAETDPDTVLYIDGSHRAFPGSDVTRFFFDILPGLPTGTRVHIHDIYLPDDYPSQRWSRLWNEQYLLGAWLLGGAARVRPLLPGHWLSLQVSAAGLSGWVAAPPKEFARTWGKVPDALGWWMEIT